MQRDDGALPTVVAIATAPIVLADGGLLAPDGLDRDARHPLHHPEGAARDHPEREGLHARGSRAAMNFSCDDWLFDVATDYTGKCIIIAAALT